MRAALLALIVLVAVLVASAAVAGYDQITDQHCAILDAGGAVKTIATQEEYIARCP